MPRPVFDKTQYELRGTEPQAFTEDQQLSINKTTSRVHGQIDWTAQLLGFNGPNYWGQSNPRQDFSYNWVGLVETMNEKRQMQTGAFGIFNKDKSYDQWPAPFNRSDVKASADFSFHIWDDDRHTYVRPLGVEKSPSFMDDPVLIVGGAYIFDGVVEFDPHSGGDQNEEEPSIFVETFYDQGLWTRLLVLRHMDGALEARLKGSKAEYLPFEVLNWEDISDWNHPQIRKQFLGIWGNKGNSLSFDFAFDALSLHGCDEHYSLFMEPTVQKYSLADILAKFGMEPTPWTGHHPEKFTFKVEGCDDIFVPQSPILGNGLGNPTMAKHWPPKLLSKREEIDQCVSNCGTFVKAWQTVSDFLYDNEEYDSICPPETHIDYDNDTFANLPQSENLLDDYEYHDPIGKGNKFEGFYNREPQPPYPTDCDEPPFRSRGAITLNNGTLEELGTAFVSSTADEGLYDKNPFSGIDGFEFTWEALNPGAILDGVCVSWLFDPSLDNGTLEESIHRLFPPLDPVTDSEWLYDEGPWASVVDGVYDQTDEIFLGPYSTYDAPCTGNANWTGFDDGEFDEEFCECETFPQADQTQCYSDPCVSEDLDCDADGGILTVYGPPNYEEECECVVDCCLVDNEEIPPPPPYLGPDLIDGDVYNLYCKPQLDPPPNIELCPAQPLYVELVEVTQSMKLSLLPSIRNSFKPLRLWKNHTLMVTDDVPTGGLFEHRNFLVADENRGTEPENTYRHFVRLPLEYTREGREWTRAVQVCRNQSYFSSPDSTNRMLFDKEDAEPIEFSSSYRDRDLSETIAIYEEGFNHSSVTEDLEQLGSGFIDSTIEVEEEKPLPYAYSGLTSYDSLDSRVPSENGEWRGKYYMRGPNPEITGHLSTDVASSALVELNHTMVYDESEVKRPNTTFADDLPEAKAKNYIVSYAYFVADLSASEEPIFEPTSSICWRNPLIDSDTVVNDECVFTPIESNTAYLLHPQELDYGKRTREPRTAGEITEAAETQDGFFERVGTSSGSYT